MLKCMTNLSRQRMRPSPSRLSSGVRSALGIGMVETLLTLAGLTVFSVVAFASYSHVSAKSKVSDESDNLRELSAKVENSFGLLGTFASVSANAIVRDGLAPERLTRGDGWLTNAWGGPVTVEPYTVTRFGDGFSIVHHNVPTQSCADFVAANSRDPWDVQVSDVSVIRNHGGRLDLQALTDACAYGDGRVAFVYHTGLVAGAAVAASPLQLPPTPTSTTPPGSPPLGGPVGHAGPVGPAAPVGPINPAPSLPPPPPAPVAPPIATPIVPVTPPAPPATPPLPPPTTVAACVESSENRTVSCPAGSVGQAFQSRRHHCGPDPLVYEAWAGTTTAGPWTDTSNTCMPCPGPESRTLACPTGQLGEIQEHRSFVCSGLGSWGSWSLTTNTCAPVCVLPTPSSQTEDEFQIASQRLDCPIGQVGDIYQSRQEQRTRTRTAYCPAPTGSFTWGGWSAWTAWAPTTGWVTTSDTCVTPPSATFVSGCDFSHYYYGRTGFQDTNCDWDPSAYWQDLATVMVGNSLDANGFPVLDSALYRVEMTSVWYGANCSASACVVYPDMINGDGRSSTRVRVYRRSDNTLLHENVVEIDFSNQ